MVKLFANSECPHQTPRSSASDLGPHCLAITILGYPDYNGLNELPDKTGFKTQKLKISVRAY